MVSNPLKEKLNIKNFVFLFPLFCLILFFLSNFLAQEKKIKGSPIEEKKKQTTSLNEPILIIDLKEIWPDETGVPYRPRAVRFDHQGRIIVNDMGKKEILIFDKKGDFIKSFGKEGEGKGEFLGHLGGIAVDSKNRIFVVDTYNYRIQVFDKDGNFLFWFGEFGTEKEKFSEPKGIVVDTDGKIYIADIVQNSIKTFDNKGQFLDVLGEKGELIKPEWITIGKTGNIYVTHHSSFCVNVYEPTGDFILSFAKQGENPGEIEDDAEGIVADKEGHIFVVDEDEGKIEVYSETGKYLLSLGKGLGYGPGEFLSPKGIDFDKTDKRLAVADTWNSRIQIFDVKDLFNNKGGEEK
ncbi:hypothetical protein ES707_06306 [subsurface metagenome]